LKKQTSSAWKFFSVTLIALAVLTGNGGGAVAITIVVLTMSCNSVFVAMEGSFIFIIKRRIA
jgi:uncharacterized protein YpmS